MRWQNSQHFGIIRCRGSIRGRNFHQNVAAATNAWFERISCSVRQRIIITYCFANSFIYQQSADEAQILDSSVSSETISDCFMYCREVCMLSLDRKYAESGKIGGPNVVIEIDECEISRRKYNQGRIVKGNWILGMIERGGTGYRLEICPDGNRSAETLLELIKKHVAPGAEIHTDLWKGYLNLSRHGYRDLTVNHSENFVDPGTGAYTQNIESSWRWVRRRLERGGVRRRLDYHLCEFLMRKMNLKVGKDLFEPLLEDIKALYTGIVEEGDSE